MSREASDLIGWLLIGWFFCGLAFMVAGYGIGIRRLWCQPDRWRLIMRLLFKSQPPEEVAAIDPRILRFIGIGAAMGAIGFLSLLVVALSTLRR